MKIKRLLSGLLCMVMLASVLAVPSFAAETYQIEDPHSAAWGHPTVDPFISMTADSIKKGGQSSVGDFMTYHNLWDMVDTYFATGTAQLTVGMPFVISTIVCHADSWADLRANKTSYIQAESSELFGQAVYSLDQSGVYFVEVSYSYIPVKIAFVVEVSADGISQAPTTPALKSFRDVSADRWSHDAIMEMVGLGMFSGTTTPDAKGVGTFDPTGTMTRAQFIVVVTRYLYGEELSGMAAGETWYSNNYELAAEKGIIKRYEFPLTDLEQPVSRQEMALIAVRAAKAQGQAMPEAVSPDKIPDYAAIDDYYKDYVRVAFSMGLISGYDSKGTFGPVNTLTREQGAMVAYRLVTAKDKGTVDANAPASGLIVIPSGGESTVLPAEEDENGILTIYEGFPTSRPAKAGDIFVKDNGVQVVLEVGPNGIVGEGQGVAPDQCLDGRWTAGGFRFDPNLRGPLTDSLGNTLNNQSYRINWSTGEGHWQKEWKVLQQIYKMPAESGTYDGQVSTDPYKLWVWDIYIGWTFNGY